MRNNSNLILDGNVPFPPLSGANGDILFGQSGNISWQDKPNNDFNAGANTVFVTYSGLI